MYIVLGVLYESFIHPITILSTLPSAGVGALLALMVSGHELDVIAIIGIILLIGIVKKNAIMMIDFALEAERSEGLSPRDAIFQACLLRFRPILMTTFAAILGALPLMLGSGYRLGAPQSARHRHRRRPYRQPGSDALHDAGHLPLFRSPGDPAVGEAPPETVRSPPERSKDEPLRPLHRASRGDHAPHHWDRLGGVPRFSEAAGLALPQVDFPTILVQASLPGASPETVASSLASPLERHLGQIAHVTEMTSASSLGQTRIILQFDIDRDIDGAARDVQAAINAARADLPTNMPTNPTYRKINPADAPILILTLASKTKTRGQMYDLASNILQQRLSQLEGIGQVVIGGAALPGVRVELNPYALSKYGIGLEDVRAALASANANSPKGAIEDDERHFQIYTNDQATRAADYTPLDHCLSQRRSGASHRCRRGAGFRRRPS